MHDAKRGSDHLLCGDPTVVSTERLNRLVDALQQREYKIVDWQCKGQPRPDFFAGSVQVKREALGELVAVLAEDEELRIGFEVFPLGIPYPEIFQVDFHPPGPQS